MLQRRRTCAALACRPSIEVEREAGAWLEARKTPSMFCQRQPVVQAIALKVLARTLANDGAQSHPGAPLIAAVVNR